MILSFIHAIVFREVHAYIVPAARLMTHIDWLSFEYFVRLCFL